MSNSTTGLASRTSATCWKLVVSLVVWLLPTAAWACPQCAGRADGGIAQFVALGVFVTFPFALAAVVVRIVKRGEAGSQQDRSAVPTVRRELS
jgi:hypothetical protein